MHTHACIYTGCTYIYGNLYTCISRSQTSSSTKLSFGNGPASNPGSEETSKSLPSLSALPDCGHVLSDSCMIILLLFFSVMSYGNAA